MSILELQKPENVTLKSTQYCGTLITVCIVIADTPLIAMHSARTQRHSSCSLFRGSEFIEVSLAGCLHTPQFQQFRRRPKQ